MRGQVIALHRNNHNGMRKLLYLFGIVMHQNKDVRITGVFIGIWRSPLRIVFRRRVDLRYNRYDVFQPLQKIDGVIEVIKQLAKERDDFITSIVEVDKMNLRNSSNRINRYVDTDRDQLYRPQKKNLISKYSRKVGQLWIATNLNSYQMRDLIQEACKAARVEFGSISDVKW